MSIDVTEWERGLDAIPTDGELKNSAEYFRRPDRFDFFTSTTVVIFGDSGARQPCIAPFGGLYSGHGGTRERGGTAGGSSDEASYFTCVPELEWPVRSTTLEVAFPRPARYN